MYLMMLLATFMSAIYGYNLSVRSDYDRDIAKKKAMAVIYKFNHQHAAVVRAISHGMKVDENYWENEWDGEGGYHYLSDLDFTFPLPGATFSGHLTNAKEEGYPNNFKTDECHNCLERMIFYRHRYWSGLLQDGTEIENTYPVSDCGGGYGCYPIALSTNLTYPPSIVSPTHWVRKYDTDSLMIGQSVFDEDQMTSRIFCTDSIRPGEKQKIDEYGYPMTDENGNPVMEKVPVDPLNECDMGSYLEEGLDRYKGTCCSTAKKKILVSYMKMDPRWVDRVTGELSLDFWNALMTQPFKNSIGIINWDDDREPTYTDVGGGDPEGNKPGWVFVGKTNYIEAYYHRQENWPNKNFPVSAKSVTRWNLPSYFSVNCNEDEPAEKCNDNGEFGAFIDQWGNEMCTEPQGCLFRISEIY